MELDAKGIATGNTKEDKKQYAKSLLLIFMENGLLQIRKSVFTINR
jgi:hypothetical protein